MVKFLAVTDSSIRSSNEVIRHLADHDNTKKERRSVAFSELCYIWSGIVFVFKRQITLLYSKFQSRNWYSCGEDLAIKTLASTSIYHSSKCMQTKLECCAYSPFNSYLLYDELMGVLMHLNISLDEALRQSHFTLEYVQRSRTITSMWEKQPAPPALSKKGRPRKSR